ncbi:MAG: DUF885 domain-containing protein [Oscillospiraceae bacterium]|jgi:uncharacterized protein (DUF885 family)|nr:DUF885 domain-containing protein [Oscillospiraceae bacterium]
MKKLLPIILAAALALSGLTACRTSIPDDWRGENTVADTDETSSSSSGGEQVPKYDDAPDEEFDEFLKRQFIDYVTADAITFHYTLRYPENFGVERAELTFGGFGAEYFAELAEKTKKTYDELYGFDYNALNGEQRLIYDIYAYILETQSDYFSDGLYYYESLLSPSSGIQSNLPIVLAEYKFRNEYDIEDYLELLTDIDRLFGLVLDFEREKSDMGLFMADFAADGVIESIYEFTATGEDNFLIETFNDKIDALYLGDGEKTAYKEKNKAKVLNAVIPAYNGLAEELSGLKGTGVNEGGLWNFEQGRRYYEYLVKNDTGSGKSVKEMADIIDVKIEALYNEMVEIASKDYDIFEYWTDPDFGYYEPHEILEFLKSATVDDYPPPADVGYTIKYVHPSLEESLSPAFYMVPPIDDIYDNVIYINNGSPSAGSLFSTLAHEGYPGHLYQITYFRDKDVNPIRKSFNFNGYDEGWATYAQFNSFKYGAYSNMTKLKEELARLLAIDSEYTLAIQSRVDIGVNYDGWDFEELKQYLGAYSINDPDVCRELYDYVIQNPAINLRYYIGFLEFEELELYARGALGGEFSVKDFNKCVLDAGPMPFPVLKGEVDKYILSARA